MFWPRANHASREPKNAWLRYFFGVAPSRQAWSTGSILWWILYPECRPGLNFVMNFLLAISLAINFVMIFVSGISARAQFCDEFCFSRKQFCDEFCIRISAGAQFCDNFRIGGLSRDSILWWISYWWPLSGSILWWISYPGFRLGLNFVMSFILATSLGINFVMNFVSGISARA